MVNYIKLVIVLILLLSGCVSYKIPVNYDNHPARTNAPICKLELSPILDIPATEAVIEGHSDHAH
ncbi:MAG: hypothetical protein KDK50_03065 [Chlamydiia bacterium]|nr:hypothetical protein [Chlamydiia bacterium]